MKKFLPHGIDEDSTVELSLFTPELGHFVITGTFGEVEETYRAVSRDRSYREVNDIDEYLYGGRRYGRRTPRIRRPILQNFGLAFS